MIIGKTVHQILIAGQTTEAFLKQAFFSNVDHKHSIVKFAAILGSSCPILQHEESGDPASVPPNHHERHLPSFKSE